MKLIVYPRLIAIDLLSFRYFWHRSHSFFLKIVFAFFVLLCLVLPVLLQFNDLSVISKLTTMPRFFSFGLISFYPYIQSFLSPDIIHSFPVYQVVVHLIVIISVFSLLFFYVNSSCLIQRLDLLLYGHASQYFNSSVVTPSSVCLLFFFASSSIYIATSTVMFSFSLRLWVLFFAFYVLYLLVSRYTVDLSRYDFPLRSLQLLVL